MSAGPSPSWPKTYSATKAPREMLDLVRRLMPLLLRGDDPSCVLLREQYARATIRQMELTGAGFYITFDVPEEEERVVPPNFEGGHVDIQVDRLEHGAGCVLFVRGGVISVLEGFTYDGEWPERPVVLDLRDPRPIAPPPRSA